MIGFLLVNLRLALQISICIQSSVPNEWDRAQTSDLSFGTQIWDCPTVFLLNPETFTSNHSWLTTTFAQQIQGVTIHAMSYAVCGVSISAFYPAAGRLVDAVFGSFDFFILYFLPVLT